jgi:hypothetical protein
MQSLSFLMLRMEVENIRSSEVVNRWENRREIVMREDLSIGTKTYIERSKKFLCTITW